MTYLQIKSDTKQFPHRNHFSSNNLLTTFITIIGNVVLSVVKLFAGIIAHSNAMISDAIHSASDVFSTFVVIIGIKLASKKPDNKISQKLNTLWFT